MYALFANCGTTDGVVGLIVVDSSLVFALTGMHHKFVATSLVPSRIDFAFFCIMTLSLQNMHMHPASHNFGTDNRFLFMSENMCAFIAAGGNSGMASSFVSLNDIMDSLAQTTLIGSCSIAFPSSSPK